MILYMRTCGDKSTLRLPDYPKTKKKLPGESNYLDEYV